jgi:hypothetical protein
MTGLAEEFGAGKTDRFALFALMGFRSGLDLNAGM